MFNKILDKYVAIQITLMLIILLTAPTMNVGFSLTIAIIGILLLAVGVIVLVKSVKELGSSLTPAIAPKEDGHLVTTGTYGIVRHPIYSGVMLLAFGWSLFWGSIPALIFSIILSVLLALKADQEEILLIKKYPEYVDYKTWVTKKFIPYIY